MKLYTVLLSTFLLFVLFVFSNLSYAQDPPVEYGDIPMEDLQMKSFPADTNASALILCDYGQAYLNDEVDLVFDRIIRIKIFNDKGYDWGTRSIGINPNEEDMDEIEGKTYYLDKDGDKEDKELDDDDIFKEKVTDNYTKYKFTMPGLTPGCIIEIHYKIISHSLGYIRNWEFQHSEPVRWSEYRIKSPIGLNFSAVIRGYEPFAVNETKEVNQYFEDKAAYFFGSGFVKCTQYRWVVKDAPALRDEPYTTTIHDYTNKVEIQLSSINVPGYSKQFLQDWDSFNKEMLDANDFYKEINVTGNVEDRAKEITSGISNPVEKMNAIYNWVAKSIVCTDKDRVFADKDVDEVLDSKKGSDAEITFLLLSLLKSQGIESNPVILSTRDNGKIQDLYPILRQFNYVLARVKIGSEYYYLDATDPLRPIDLIPARVLNVKGLVVKKGSPDWVNFKTRRQKTSSYTTKVNLNEDGSVECKTEAQYEGYAALIVRNDFSGKEEKEAAKDLLKTEKYGFTIDSVNVQNKDSVNKPLNLTVWTSSPDYAQSSGDMIYINPFVVNRMRENPFKSAVRKFPVDYGYKSSLTSIVNIKIPAGYKIKESIKDHRYTVGRNYLVYEQEAKVDSGNVQISSRMNVRSIQIDPQYYSKLKELYGLIINAQSEELVLEKIKDNSVNKNNAAGKIDDNKKGN